MRGLSEDDSSDKLSEVKALSVGLLCWLQTTATKIHCDSRSEFFGGVTRRTMMNNVQNPHSLTEPSDNQSLTHFEKIQVRFMWAEFISKILIEVLGRLLF